MDKRRIRPFTLIGILLFAVLAACTRTIPAPEIKQPDGPTLTPNLTLTAWAIEENLPTDTPEEQTAPKEPPADQPATEEPAVPTDTPLPEPSPTSEPTATEPAGSQKPITVTETTIPLSLASGEVKLSANFLNTPPPIDGDINDWPGKVYAADMVVVGQEYYANSLDLFGEFKLAWDAEYLYIGVLVRDSWFVQTASGSKLGQGDSIEILLDADLSGDAGSIQMNADDFQLGFSPGNLLANPIPEAYRWAPFDNEGPLETSLVAGRLTDDGYMVEIAIAWDELGVTPTGGMTLGLLLSVSDNDTTGVNAQQTVISFQERNLTNPDTWAPVELVGP
jgi:hypothetical protein